MVFRVCKAITNLIIEISSRAREILSEPEYFQEEANYCLTENNLGVCY